MGHHRGRAVFSDGRAVRAVTLRCPAALRAGRYTPVPAFADIPRLMGTRR
jgi:hypothetical protein